ncbi:oxygenase MpaB family protein [Sphingomonas naphthae]|uniref:Oxygenase MpaB family protein n=1 Tax=Sphingomonas naphthae TaxID=1813468 RepID=A0ABY7THR9_9SPHN|nr:oxygenase MpaB family protein [Sphingomonas naphthae]WCT72694.1 oxygenase MpaB family protein [Sphingomonas naphthae]
MAKQAIVARVRSLFNDQDRGEEPVQRSSDALFASDSAIWRVHGDVTTMMVGGISALLLQMLHPAVLAGVWDHSNFRTDMLGRLRRTARFIALTTYGSRDQAESAIARVRSVHENVAGVLADGTEYSAGDPHRLAWVHVTEATSFLEAWQRYGDRPLTSAEQDTYFREFAQIAQALGADPVPTTKVEALRLLNEMRRELVVDDRTREVARLVLRHRPDNPLAIPVQAITAQTAVDLLPAWARRMHGLRRSPFVLRPAVKVGALGLAGTLRWAFSGG